jgi:hypothetical protein
MHAQAQNIEGQLVASQFGEWKVPSIGIGFSFDPASCQLSAGGKNFAAFSNGTPIKVVDENPGLTEVSNTTVYAHVDPSSCSVSLGGLAYGHASFYLTSGTGGLQEALSNGIQRTGGSNTVILNAEWYALVAPSNPATVIASVHGSTTLGLVDVTTTPYTNYSWNGTQYILSTITGATIPATSLVLKGAGTLGASTPATPGTDYVIPSGSITGAAANLSGTPNLPNGTAATTQATNDNTTKIATDAFVKAAVSGNSTYTAGTGGIAANTVVMGNGAGGVIPFVNSTTSTANYGLYTGIATATAAVGTQVPVANSSGQLVACQFDGTPVVGDTVIGSLTTPGDCHDAGITGNYVTLYMPVVGWVQSVSGTLGTVRMAGLGVWGSANLIVNNTTGTQSLYGGLTLPAVNASQVDTVYDVDGFVSAASYLFRGVGVAQTAYSGTTGYYQCSAVSYSGNNYLSVGYYTLGTAPGTSSAIWYPVPNANTPTALDCAFYTAAAGIITGTGTITGNSQGSTLQLGIGTYNSCIGLMEPTVTTPGWWTVSIKGSAIGPSKIYQNCSISNPVLEQPPSTANYDLARFLWENFTVDAHENAPAVVGLYGSQQSTVRNLDLYNAALGNDHYMEIGAAGNEGWVYELEMHNIQLGATYGGCNGATFSTAVTSGVPTVTVTNGGSGCNVNWPPTPVLIQPGGTFCSGTNTLTYSSGAITGWTTTASSCNSATTASVYSGPNVSYGFKFTNMSDSHDIDSLVCGGIGSVDCIYISNVTSFNTFYKMHPIGTMDGIQNNGRNDFFATQMDSVFRRGFDFESGFGTVNVYGSLFEWANPSQENGAGDYYFGATSNPPTNAPYSINIFGDMCGSSPAFTNYYHFSSSGSVVDTTSAGMPSTVHVHETNYCNQTGNSPTNAPDYVGLQYNWSPGAWGNVFQFNMNPTAGGTPTMTLTNPLTVAGSDIGVYDWDWGTASSASSSFNAKSPIMGWCSPYWNGTATTPLCVNTQLSYASGANPLATLAFTYSGTLPTAGARYTFDNPVVLPTGSTAVTQSAGDNSTKVATDAFVLANAGTAGNPGGSTTQAQYNNGGAFSGSSTFLFNTSTGEASNFSLTNTGTFGSSNYASYLNVAVTGSSGYAGNCALNSVWYNAITSAITGCVSAPASGTGTKITNGAIFSAYTQDTNLEAVGLITNGYAYANGTTAYSQNPLTTDLVGLTSNVVLVNQEDDLQPLNPPSAYLAGVNFRATLAYTGTPSNTGNYPFDAFTVNTNVPGAYMRSAMTTYTGTFSNSYGSVLNINANGTATSTSGNYNCPRFMNIYETYWTGSANANEQWNFYCQIAAGSTPSDYFRINNLGGATGANHYFDFMNGIQLELDGSTSGSAYLAASPTGGTLNINAAGGVALTNTVNNAAITFGTGSGGDSTCPTPVSGSSFLCTQSSGISASINGAPYGPIAVNLMYTVSTLPAASSLAAGTQLTVSDATSFTPGTCTGGGSDYMIAITNGSSWSCH